MTEKINKELTLETEGKEVAQIDNSLVTPMSMLQAARAQNASLEQMQQLMDMQFKWETNEARKAYFAAVAKFKSEEIHIAKDKKNAHFGSKYSGIGNLVNTVNPILSKYELSANWNIEQEDGLIKVTCVLSHSQGHSESVPMTGEPDTSGGSSKNPIQQAKSTVTYLKIATYEAVTGVASYDDPGDNDGNSVVKPITTAQVKTLEKMITDKNADKAAFLHHFSIDEEGLEGLPGAKFSTAKRMLEAKK